MSRWLRTWRQMLTAAMARHGESFDDVVAAVGAGAEWLDAQFDAGFGGPEGAHFTVWTRRRVYFPTCYDGAEGVGSIARNPDSQPTEHIGGW